MLQELRYQQDQLLSYAEYGDPGGYPILIQHGLIASIRHAELFERLVQLGTRLICIARPGYGESSPYIMKNIAEWGEIVSVLIDALELSRFDLLGMSSGAPYTYAIGHRFPQMVRNIFIFSGIPALYDEKIHALWPWEVNKQASMAELEKLAFDLFFAHLSPADLEQDDIRDAMRNHCFGIAQDFKLRFQDWGFALSSVKEAVFMRHSKVDDAVPFATAEMTSRLLPNCRLEVREKDEHFSNELLDDFIRTTMAEQYRPG